MNDPKFRDTPDMTALRYTQIPSFLRAPMSRDLKRHSSDCEQRN